MKRTEQIMGMPVIVQLPNVDGRDELFDRIFDYFRSIDKQFSPYSETSEVSHINRTKSTSEVSEDMRLILALADQTKQETNGYFDVWHNGSFDPSGVVKGWAIQQAAGLLIKAGQTDFYVEAGGDIMTGGHNEKGELWSVGIRNPFNRYENVKVVQLDNKGIATSGTAIRGQHIYDPHQPNKPLDAVASLTVIGPTIYDADRFATAAFAMGSQGIQFINNLDGFEGYMIDTNGLATMTDGFEGYTK